MKTHVLFALAALGLLAQAAPALATPTTISLNQVWTGSQPDGNPAWLVATFNQTSSTTGTLTLTSDLNGSDFLQGLESSNSAIGWAFFVNQAVTGITCTSGDCANSNSGFNAITTNSKGNLTGGFNAGPVPGGFNLAFGWDVGSRFLEGSSAIYQLTFSAPFTGSPITYNTDGWSSVAHVQGIGNGSCSGWIVAGKGTDAQGITAPCTNSPPVSVPEPRQLGIFGLGLLLIGTFFGLRHRYS